jgi:hypothetical protein
MLKLLNAVRWTDIAKVMGRSFATFYCECSRYRKTQLYAKGKVVPVLN